ncbi:MAG: nucleotide exchange factor GrpE [Candidatus Shapirobacteria bacterium]|nr:nucleotide exchange factor GrpE [Candidatus Shapirobacteria bacterium]
MDKKKKSVSEKKILDLEGKWKRALADYANLEKRIDNEKQYFVKFCNAQLLEKLLLIVDDLERCEKHLQDQGLSLTLNKLKEVLKNEGLEEIKAQGEEFDPQTMEAIEIVEGPENKIIEVVNKGYHLGDRVLRIAKVKVGRTSLKDN